MGWGIVPDIHDENLVCQQPCQHRYCALNRQEWGEAKCRYCGKPLLAGEAYYREDGNVKIHFRCAWDEEDKRRASL